MMWHLTLHSNICTMDSKAFNFQTNSKMNTTVGWWWRQILHRTVFHFNGISRTLCTLLRYILYTPKRTQVLYIQWHDDERLLQAWWILCNLYTDRVNFTQWLNILWWSCSSLYRNFFNENRAPYLCIQKQRLFLRNF